MPIIYFGTDTATLLPAMKETGAEVIGLDWRIPLDEGWHRIGEDGRVQGNLDPAVFSPAGRNCSRARKKFCAVPPDVPATSLTWTWNSAGDAGRECEGSGGFRQAIFKADRRIVIRPGAIESNVDNSGHAA